MGTLEEQRSSSWASRLAEAHREHVEAHRDHLHGHMRPLRRDAQEHHQRILEAARRLFAEQGVENVSMRQIALAAGVGQGTLYRRYAHKGELCMDLLHTRVERLMDEIAAQLTATADAPALTRMDGALTQMVGMLEEQGALIEAIVASHLHDHSCEDDEHTDARPKGLRDIIWYRLPHEVFVGLLTEAVECGELRPLDVEYTADAILATFDPMFYRFQRDELGYSQERILQGLRRIFITGLQTS